MFQALLFEEKVKSAVVSVVLVAVYHASALQGRNFRTRTDVCGHSSSATALGPNLYLGSAWLSWLRGRGGGAYYKFLRPTLLMSLFSASRRQRQRREEGGGRGASAGAGCASHARQGTNYA